MKLNIHAKLNDSIHTKLRVNVGNGENTFRWLGLVVARRFILQAPHGCIRSCEHSYFVPPDSHILPVNLRSTDHIGDCFFHPHAIISDFCEDNQTILVDLEESFELDEYNIPIHSSWFKIAFEIGCSAEEVMQLEKELIVELEMDRLKRFDTEHRLHRQKIEPKLAEMREVMRDQLYDEDLNHKAASSEWAVIYDSGLLKDISSKAQGLIFELILERFSEFSDLFKNYGAVNSGGSSSTLEYIEYTKLMSDLGFAGSRDFSNNDILNVFNSSQIVGPSEVGAIEGELRLPEFLVVMIRLAEHKFITMPKQNSVRDKESKRNKSVSHFMAPSYAEALEMLFIDYLKPLLDKFPPDGTSVRTLIGSEEVLLYFHEIHDRMKVLFDEIACLGDNGVECDISDRTIDAKEFASFIENAGLLSLTSDGGKELSMKDVRVIFSSSQHDTVTNEDEAKLIEDEDNDRDVHLEHMVFSEFLEAIARVGLIKWASYDITPLEKLRRSVEMSCLMTSSV